MKHLRQTLLFILLGFLLSACRHTADRLLSIEQLIRLKPDSALSLLRQIQYPERLSDSNGALYALLMTQVINQSSDEGHKSDSLISVQSIIIKVRRTLLMRHWLIIMPVW